MNKKITFKSVLYLFSGTAFVIGTVWALYSQAFAIQDFAKAILFFQLVAIIKALSVTVLGKLKLGIAKVLTGTAISAVVGVWTATWVLAATVKGVEPMGPILPVMVLEALISPWLLYWACYALHYGKWESDHKARYYKALEHQIHHHFLFNTLNTTVCLIDAHPALATANLESLASLYREMLNQKEMSTVAKEISITESYIRMEKLRLGERVETHWSYLPEVLDFEVPSMILQPLVENAVYHGIETSTQSGCIEISIQALDGQRIALTVCNPCNGQRQSLGNHCAHSNLEKRMEMCYGEANFKFFKHKQIGSYCAELILPSTGRMI